MGSAERRKRENADTRQRILDAARELFVQHGYEATSMRSIAERIEYTPTAIYHHFASKERLFTELCTQDFLALASAFQRIGRVEDPVERLSRIGEAYIEFGLQHPRHYQLMFMTPSPPHDHADGPVKGDPSQDAYAFLRATVEEAVRQGRLLDEYRDPDLVAQILWAVLHGLISLRIAKSQDPWVDFGDVRRTAEAARNAVMAGLLR